MRNIKRMLLPAAASLFCIFLFSGCIPQPVSASAADGTWYEQNESGGIVTIKNNTLTYESDSYTQTVPYSPLNTDEGFELVPEEDFIYIDIFYNRVMDNIIMHTLPHTDGDGGYHVIEFLRTGYAAPPPPVYGDRIDSTDASAPKAFSDYTVKRLTLDVVEPWRDNGDMAQELPDQGIYSYELTAAEDGTAGLSSDFCRTITLSREQMQTLSGLLEESRIAELNGIDIITEEMPEDTYSYELNIEFASGETYHSRANGGDVSEIWETGGRALHKLLFEDFVEAGYNPSTGEFHSSEPMMRIRNPESDPADYSVTVEGVEDEIQGTVYDYTVSAEYPVFQVEGNASEGLQETLSGLTQHYKDLCTEDLEYENSVMASVPEATWKQADRRYAYSFYATTHEKADATKYYFWISEGHVNCFGLGKHEYGDYKYIRFCLDAKTGEPMSLSDFFKDENALLGIMTGLLEGSNYSDEAQVLLHSDEYQEILRRGITTPEMAGGIGFEPVADGILICINEDFDARLFYPYNMKIYYEDVQDLLNDKYASVRSV